MRNPKRFAFYAILVGGLLLSIGAQAQERAKLLILPTASDTCGDSNSTACLVANSAFINTLVFDGIVVKTNQDYGWNVMLPGATVDYTSAFNQFTQIENALTADDNFALVYVQDVDPFDSWTDIINKWVTYARAARDAGLKGFVFDNEPYNGDPWYYPDVKYGSTKTLAEYREQWRQRGKDLMNALKAEWPEMEFMTLHGPYYCDERTPDYVIMEQGAAFEEDTSCYFYAGLLEAAPVRKIDGGEVYQYRTPSDFENSYQYRKHTIATLSPNPLIPPSLQPIWPTKTSISFGVYDQRWKSGFPMDATILRTTITNACNRADDYVWLYTERRNYLKAGAIGQQWHDAVRNGMNACVGSEPPPPPDTTPPTVPSGLSATATSSSQIDLSWTASTDNVGVTGYDIFRDGSLLTTVTGTSHTDSGLLPSTTYSYQVRAKDAAGNLSDLSASASATTPAAPAGPSPVGFWRFDAGSGTTAVDASGNGITGTLAGAVTWNASGKSGSALSFTGGTGRVTLPNNALLKLDTYANWSVAAWINPSQLSSLQYPIIYTYGDWVASLGLSDTTSGTDGRLEHWRNNSTFINSTGAVPVNVWTHVAVVRTPTGTTFYINGVASGTGGSATISSAGASAIGGAVNGYADGGFAGRIDDVRVYNVALTAEQVAAIAGAP